METSLVRLLESPEQKEFGRKKRETLPGVCLKCDVLDMCNGGCPKNRFMETPDGQPGLNYLCAGYHRFFNHCRPFVDEIARIWHSQMQVRESAGGYPVKRGSLKTRRNDPCPCGSGRKYKNCCMGKIKIKD